MRVEETPIAAVTLDPPLSAPLPRPSRLWVSAVPAAVYWGWLILSDWLELPTFARFGSRLLGGLLLALFTIIWWWVNRRTSLRERALGFAIVVITGIIAIPLCDESTGVAGLGILTGPLSVVLTAWTFAALLTRRASPVVRLTSIGIGVSCAWALLAVVRLNGLTGELHPEFHWRWSPSAEEAFLAERGRSGPAPSARGQEDRIRLQPGDWPGFRGPMRDGILRDASIRTDWKARAPKLVWCHRVGPAWSSLVVVDGRIFTQEQRQDQECVVCYQSTTGQELWSYGDSVRFFEETAGPGPRATPAFANNRVFTVGCTGILNCLDAATGKKLWSHELAADSGAELPHWGFTGSPLIVDERVVVFAGGKGATNLLAYDVRSGDLAWSAPAGETSYASPLLATIAGVRQVLMWSNRGLTAVDPESGAVLWEHLVPVPPSAPRSITPVVYGASQVLIASESDLGLAMLDVEHASGTWTATRRWTSRALKPAFNDLVIFQGHAFGFDGRIFTAVDLATGSRRWKEGRFGEGQVLLLERQGALLVASETGEAVLLKADPNRYEELARFQAIDGKTWTQPAIVNGLLFLRNAEEMACYDVATTEPL